jgi:transcriptional regulator with XRE-family HTH domain
MEEILRSCASNVRRLRIARDLSVSELARRSGVAKGTLSTLEMGQGNPTIETLSSLARALAVPFADLVAEPLDSAFVVRADELSSFRFPGAAGRIVDRVFGREVIDVVEVIYPMGEIREAVPDAPGTVTRLYVAEGRLALGLPHETLELRTGDFARFSSDVPHRYTPDEGPARVLQMVNYGPASAQGSTEDPVLRAIKAASDAAASDGTAASES